MATTTRLPFYFIFKEIAVEKQGNVWYYKIKSIITLL